MKNYTFPLNIISSENSVVVSFSSNLKGGMVMEIIMFLGVTYFFNIFQMLGTLMITVI